jgi:hypothetical protein
MFFSLSAQCYELPRYTVTWHEGTTIGVLFRGKISDSQIKNIIYKFKEIRQKNEFDKYFPGALPLVVDNNYIIKIKIFTNANWASRNINYRYINNKMTDKLVKQYANNIRGYYAWDGIKNDKGSKERGTLGFAEDGGPKSKNFRILF